MWPMLAPVGVRIVPWGSFHFFTYILPVAVISFTYLRISRKINRSSLFIKAMRQEQQQGKKMNPL